MSKIGYKVFLCGDFQTHAQVGVLVDAEEEYKEQGYEVINPARMPDECLRSWGWLGTLLWQLQALESCDAIDFLPTSYELMETESNGVVLRWLTYEANILYLAARQLEISILSEDLLGLGGH